MLVGISCHISCVPTRCCDSAVRVGGCVCLDERYSGATGQCSRRSVNPATCCFFVFKLLCCANDSKWSSGFPPVGAGSLVVITLLLLRLKNQLVPTVLTTTSSNSLSPMSVNFRVWVNRHDQDGLRCHSEGRKIILRSSS